MSDNETVVSIKNLSHRYGKDWAIQNVNFEINHAEIVGLLGSNGAGKSTTMNILCGIISQTKGEAIIDEFDIKQNAIEAKKLLGFLPQKPPLYLDLTVDEYLRHCARLRQIPNHKINESVEHVKEYCGVKEYSRRLLGNLSGGYQQRVGIAQAIIHNPKLVVLDEPTNGLDPVQITEVRALIRKLSKTSAVLISTHILSEVRALCEQIIMIEKGQTVFKGGISQFNDLVKPSKLIVSLQNPPIIEDLVCIAGIKDAKHVDGNNIEIVLYENAAVEEDLIQKSVEKNWGLKELYKEKVSLEAVFAKLSNRELKD